MITKVSFGKGFSGSNNYFSQEGKLDRFEARNLPARDHKTNANYMQLTAQRSDRVESPVMNLSVSWDRGDQPTEQQMFDTADQMMNELGFGDHQYMIYSHKDTDQPHVHIMVNRVHEDTEKARYVKDLYPKIDGFQRQKEIANDWRFTPGRYSNKQHLQRAGLKESVKASNIHTRIKKTSADRVLFNAESWEKMNQQLADKGFGIDKLANGGGQIYRLENPKDRMKLSGISQQLSMKKMEKRIGAEFSEKGKSVDPQEEEIAKKAEVYYKASKKLIERNNLANSIAHLNSSIKNIGYWKEQRADHLNKLKKKIEQAYKEPGRALDRIKQDISNGDYKKVQETLRDRPEEYGELKGGKKFLRKGENEARKEARKITERASLNAGQMKKQTDQLNKTKPKKELQKLLKEKEAKFHKLDKQGPKFENAQANAKKFLEKSMKNLVKQAGKEIEQSAEMKALTKSKKTVERVVSTVNKISKVAGLSHPVAGTLRGLAKKVGKKLMKERKGRERF